MDLQRMREFHCDVCFEMFGENLKCPKMLMCGHSFCHSCLENMLVQSPTCPNCKQGIQFTSADDIPVNYTVKNIVSCLKIPESLNGHNSPLNSDFAKEQKKDSVNSLPLKKELASEELPYEGYCKDHHVNKHFRCMECNCWICGDCATLNHKSCRTILVAVALDEMKQEIRQEFKAEIEAQKLHSKNLNKNLIYLKKKRLSIKNEMKILRSDLKRKLKYEKSVGKDIENLQSMKSDSKKYCEKLKLMKSSVEETSNDDQFMKAKNKWNEFLIEAKKLTKELTITRYFKCRFSLELLSGLCHEGPVYASRCQNGLTQYGKVVVKRERVWVYCFKPQKPNQKDVIISFRNLLINFSGSSKLPRRGFIQVEENTTFLGDIVIATDALTARAKNFLLLCSGIKGKSQEGVTFYYMEEYGIGTVDERGAIVKGIKDVVVYEPPVTKGFVYGYEVDYTDFASSLHIWMKDEPIVVSNSKFGFVEEGIDVCERMYNNSNQVFTIKHCGLVI